MWKKKSSKNMSKENAIGEPVDKWCQRFLAPGNGVKMLMKEYEAIRAAPCPPFCGAFNQNSALNRYGNIHLIDESRLILTDGLQPDYFHANWVDGYKSKKAYILTQAPTEASVKDYWRMVWQERAQVLVCLTSLKEKGSPKAELFFPTTNETPYRAGALRVILTGVKEFPPRRIAVIHVKLYCWFGKSGRERDVSIVYYGDWPDRAVPPDSASFLDLLLAVEQLRTAAAKTAQRPKDASESWKPPVVVNCSAGVGRSATFVACQIENERLREFGMIHPNGTVRRLRNQRAGAVQNYIQYTFICREIMEAARRFRVGKAKTGTGSQRT